MTANADGARRSWLDRWLAVTDLNVSRRTRDHIALTTAVVGWLTVSVWMVVQRDAPRWPGVMVLAVVFGVLGLSYLVAMLLGERPGGRVVLRWAALVVILHLAVVTALLFTIVREPNRLGKALDTVLIAPGLGILFAGLGLVVLSAVLGVSLGVVTVLDLTTRAVRDRSLGRFERVRTLSLAACVLGATLAFICLSITPRPAAMPDSIHGKGAGAAIIYYLFLQAFGITETRPGWYEHMINIVFIVSLFLIAQILLRPLWTRLLR